MPLIPLTREVSKIRRLVRSLAVYRMVFGQPRQEDLLALLEAGVEGDAVEEAWQISLRPVGVERERSGNGKPVVVEPGPPLWKRLDAGSDEAVVRPRLGYEEVWRGLLDALAAHDLAVDMPTASGMNQVRFDFPRGRGVFSYSFKHKEMRFYWLVKGDEPKPLFDELVARKEEGRRGAQLLWRDAEVGEPTDIWPRLKGRRNTPTM